MTTFTREQLEFFVNRDRRCAEHDIEAAWARSCLALLDRAEKAEYFLNEIQQELVRKSLQMDELIDSEVIWKARADKAEATCKELLQVQAEWDRLRKENKSLREANEIDLGEKAPLIFENAELKARNEILREELRDAEEAIRYVAHGDGYDCYRSESSPEPRGVVGYTGVGGVWFAFPEEMQPAVRRALKQKE